MKAAIASPSPLAGFLHWVGSRCLDAAQRLEPSPRDDGPRPADRVPHEDVIAEMRDRILTRYY